MKAYAIAAALAAVVIGAAPGARAGTITPTYGAFVEGGIGNNGARFLAQLFNDRLGCISRRTDADSATLRRNRVRFLRL